VCDSEEQAKIQKEQAKITKDTTVIYTLGYEGISLKSCVFVGRFD
jgi:hypothetical protein